MEDLSNQKPIESFFNPEAMMYLHYDAQIMLSFSRKNNSYVLHAQGFNETMIEIEDQELFLEEPNECLFRVLPLARYKARQTLDNMVAKFKAKYSEKNQENLETQLTKLDRENKTRFLELQKLRGKFISFHTPIQLQHVVSHKYLTLKHPEEGGMENAYFSLEDYPQERSILKILPSFKFQTENQKYVRYDQEVYISTHELEENFFMYITYGNDQSGSLSNKISTHKIVKGNTKLKSKLE